MGILDLFSSKGRKAAQADPHALAAAGRWREAYLAALALDPQAQDVELQRNAMLWRNVAAGSYATGGGFAPMPEPNPFPWFTTTLAEIKPADLTPKLLSGALHHQGSLIVRGLLDEATVAELKAGVDHAFEAKATAAATGRQESAWYAPAPLPDPELEPTRGFGGDHTLLTADSPALFGVWAATLERVGLLDLVGAYLGERPVLSARKATLYRTPAQPLSTWRQEGAVLGRSTRTVNLWVALSDCGVDAPTLDIVPWRIPEMVQTNSHGAYFEWSVGDGKIEEILAGRPMASPVFKAGDAILFDQMCLYRTGVRPGMTQGSYAMETWMFAPSAYADRSRLLV